MSAVKLADSQHRVNGGGQFADTENGKATVFVVKLQIELWHRKISMEGMGEGMRERLSKRSSLIRLGMVLAFVIAFGVPGAFASTQLTTVHVEVKDAQTGKPIYQARLTLRFRQHGGFLHRSKIISYTSKTDPKGMGAFPVVPLGVVTLMVTAPNHNTFGKEFKITKANQVIEVKLQKPHPVL